MNHHQHGHVYRAQDVDRIVSQFGRKPPEHVKQKLRESLSQERETFLAQSHVRQQRQRGRDTERER